MLEFANFFKLDWSPKLLGKQAILQNPDPYKSYR
jgi:hypothetical protein